MKRIAFYIDSHGFGHSTRSIALASRFPEDWEIVFKTNGPAWLFAEELSRDYEQVPSDLDLHPIQSEGYRVDVERTRDFLVEKIRQSHGLIERERHWLEKQRIDLILSDISPLALEAGFRSGIPCHGVSNFTWHWIMEPMIKDGQGLEALSRIEEMVAHSTCNFRLPFSVPEVFPQGSIEAPLLARRPLKGKESFRQTWGMDRETPYVLVTFGGFDTQERDLSILETMTPIQFIRVSPHDLRKDDRREHLLVRDPLISNLWRLGGAGLYHPDLVAAVDAVITKPGYGILSETMPLGIPMLLDSREDFREFGAIHSTLSEYPQVVFLPSARMANLDFAEELKTLLGQPRLPWKGATDSGEFIVDRIQ